MNQEDENSLEIEIDDLREYLENLLLDILHVSASESSLCTFMLSFSGIGSILLQNSIIPSHWTIDCDGGYRYCCFMRVQA